MSNRMDVLHGVRYEQNGEQKIFFTRVGSAFPAKTGDGWNVFLRYLPTERNEKGEAVLMLRPPKEHKPTSQDYRQDPRQQAQKHDKREREFDDEIPL